MCLVSRPLTSHEISPEQSSWFMPGWDLQAPDVVSAAQMILPLIWTSAFPWRMPSHVVCYIELWRQTAWAPPPVSCVALNQLQIYHKESVKCQYPTYLGDNAGLQEISESLEY